jgi:hypothetical protein
MRGGGDSVQGHHIVDHKRIAEISTEMSSLLEQQRALLNDTSGSIIKRMPSEEVGRYAERNQRLRDLCNELMKVG